MNVAVQVDDFVATPSEYIRAEFDRRLKFFGDDRANGGDETSYELGTRNERDIDAKTLALTQGAFTRSVLKQFNIGKVVKPVMAPLPSTNCLGKWEGTAAPTSLF